MERITIDVTRDELNFIREAVEHKINLLKNYFNDCETESKKISTVTISTPIAVHHSMVGKDHAPWGLKKDGTPRARPGRKSVKTRKARA